MWARPIGVECNLFTGSAANTCSCGLNCQWLIAPRPSTSPSSRRAQRSIALCDFEPQHPIHWCARAGMDAALSECPPKLDRALPGQREGWRWSTDAQPFLRVPLGRIPIDKSIPRPTLRIHNAAAIDNALPIAKTCTGCGSSLDRTQRRHKRKASLHLTSCSTGWRPSDLCCMVKRMPYRLTRHIAQAVVA